MPESLLKHGVDMSSSSSFEAAFQASSPTEINDVPVRSRPVQHLTRKKLDVETMRHHQSAVRKNWTKPNSTP
ncbi:hypothetical protein CCGE531_30725 (plasmid) [Rhizobium sp. CCGE531]|nr:hypothetical protein CCGE531_30725 [Rhizobium sp. CCGE531]